ncbi:auxin-responsive protein IAA18 isoform X1 [Amborella trichopoda]|uniref:Auxin-responsive protein n=1 Tax=Amborella trichopoda TaxID=13333 RepID=U5D491_AMBTC|nr:auxin-responsive protein IAA18 isoform X1 [Amborella trichopoda]ERN15168.1 hypothetical protein AMTR_s00056p00143320 [Amborella trichopoda]|eukprot:XP_006853701.1 auxin-responsive protein IAA18 isoform X1 [Amborella trichopoda]
MSEEGEMNPNQNAPPFLQMMLENGKISQRNGVEKEERESFRVLEEGRLGPKTRETELRLGPPGDYQALNCPSPVSKNGSFCGAKRGFQDTVASKPATSERNQKLSGEEAGLLRQQPAFSLYQKSLHQKTPTFLLSKQASPSTLVRETASAKMETQKRDERETVLSAPSNLKKPSMGSSEERAGRVVGWPPIRSFRKNLTSTSSKPQPQPINEPINGSSENLEKQEAPKKGMFVKINMDGIPIGRKVDLNAYRSYEKLSGAVDELFRGLLAAQSDSSASSTQSGIGEKLRGLLDGSGEYTLVYEDNEGDRMLVGDVPWEMFVSTVKRLRVLKSSELSGLCITSGRQEASSATEDCLVVK